jgi:hypothetical protein
MFINSLQQSILAKWTALSLLFLGAGCSVARTAVKGTAKVGGFVAKESAHAVIKTGEVAGHEMHRAADDVTSSKPSPTP